MDETHGSQAASDDPAFVISRTFHAPAHAVFAAWADGATLQRWFGPPGMTVETKTVDVRPGGVFHYAMTMPNGQVLWGHWTFREVAPPIRLAFVSMFSDAEGGLGRNPWTADWPDHVMTTVTFAEHDGRTTLTLHAAPLNATEAEQAAFLAAHGGMHQGWTGTLDQLEAALAKQGTHQMKLNPHLQFNGNCAAAFEFYARALGGTIQMMMKAGESPMAAQVPADKRDTIIHARMAVGDTLLMGSDAMEGHYQTPAGFHVTLGFDDPAEAERVYAALSEGGTLTMPIQETFWAQRFGMLVDRFGTPWMVNCEKPA